MQACNRRNFLTRVALGAAALAAAGGALADPKSSSVGQESCANCQFYKPAPDGTTGSCAVSGTSVSAAGGCGEFVKL